ncbi:MAG: hypothetical protein ACRD5I_05095 [Candidatus Acidiferrales bacterium]
MLSKDLGYLVKDDFQRLDSQCDSIGRMITALGRSLRARNHRPGFISRQSRVARSNERNTRNGGDHASGTHVG